MNILISGSTGLTGSRLMRELQEAGHNPVSITRADFSGSTGALAAKLSGADVVIHLAGAPIVARWSETYKREIIASRRDTTRKLVEAMRFAKQAPGYFISTSAVGIYPDGVVLDEGDDRFAEGFLADVCRSWEEEALAAAAVTKVAVFRLGVVLAREGGALPKMLPAFRFGLGGPLAGGKQGFSWIHIHDLMQAYHFAIKRQPEGIFNLTAPDVTDNAGYTRVLASVLNRPALFPVPAFVLKLAFGEGATALTAGQKAVPARLLKEGFVFKFPRLEEALKDLLKER